MVAKRYWAFTVAEVRTLATGAATGGKTRFKRLSWISAAAGCGVPSAATDDPPSLTNVTRSNGRIGV
jgi:hypothetical protein